MRIVVTGGAGFIGTALLRALAATSREVVVLDSLRPDVHRDGGLAASARLSSLGVRLVVADVRDRSAVLAQVEGADAVVHLAAKVGLGVDLDDMDDYVSSNSLGTATVLRACHTAGVERVVQASSMVVYGEGAYECAQHGPVAPAPRTRDRLARGEFDPGCPVCGADLDPALVDEDAVLDPRNTYAATKVAQEQLGAVWARETGGSCTSLRLHNVYGPGMPRDTPYAGVAAIFWSAARRGTAPQVFEDGGQRRDFVHVDDVAAAFVAALQSPEPGHAAYNVGSGVVHTIGELAAELSSLAGGPPPEVTGAYRLGDVRHITASSERAAHGLGWRGAVALRDGLRDLAFS
ncbi:dTDP-L-rhamnose 4-epimerase [Pedococcus dokdonensis]|uniref:dTDP-L-rhamnose 4-epimerase n=1 Tax=Pedococcus dokdonensis TaxID=443156 RepID=A0A1H0QUK5_9MICO|nr:NAD-dependent epimerase/dehydratase family protein [Pedococcus dokdonensis]SDP20489.1 dTDP-L-rhamnose 4-epimerase [Pedococcus dokdonensis]